MPPKLSTFPSSLFGFLRLRYNVDRPYEQKWLTITAYCLILLAGVILIPVNYALQGYETITTNKQDPNTTSVHWYHIFTGKPTPGSECDDHLFNLGDTFKTSVGTLSYTLQSCQYNSSDGINYWGGTTIPYKGLSTDFCDITSVSLQVGPAVGSVVGKASITCIHKDFQINATTSIDSSDVVGPSPFNPLYYLLSASQDLLIQPLQLNGQGISGSVSTDGVTITSATGNFSFCPMFLIKNETDPYGAAIAPNATSQQFCTPQEYGQPIFATTPVQPVTANSTNITQFVTNAMENYLEVLASVVRFDLGSRLPSNFLVNPSVVLSQNQTFLLLAQPSVSGDSSNTTGVSARDLAGSRRQTSAAAYDGSAGVSVEQITNESSGTLSTLQSYSDQNSIDPPTNWTVSIQQPNTTNLTTAIQQAVQQGYLPRAPPFNASAPNQIAPTTLATTYECHLASRKSIASAAVSVIVATQSIGSSIWGFLMLAAAFFGKRDRRTNYEHSLEEGLSKPLTSSEGYSQLQEKSSLHESTSHDDLKSDV